MLTSIINQSKLFLKKRKGSIIFLIVLAIIISVSAELFEYQTEASGIVTQLGTNSIVLSNKFFERTITLNNPNIDLTQIKIGDKVKIARNIQGDVISVTISNKHNNYDKYDRYNSRNIQTNSDINNNNNNTKNGSGNKPANVN